MATLTARARRDDPRLWQLFRAIAAGEHRFALNLLDGNPQLTTAAAQQGATRAGAISYFLDEIGTYVYAGSTPLHVAAAAYDVDVIAALIQRGADVRAANRRGAEPLHFASVGQPGSRRWNPAAQVKTIKLLVRAGADPNSPDKGGATALHRAVRTRCSGAVHALLRLGANARAKNKLGSTPMALALRTTGRGGSGSPAAKAEQQLILQLLRRSRT